MMSRSRKKTPISGVTTAPTEKDDKRAANRRLRREVRKRLAEGGDATALPDLREISDAGAMAKDGKTRFDPGQRPEELRK
jgi:hypothetical protein